MRRRCLSGGRQGGFTLIEVLVALTLLAVIAGIVTGGLNFVAKAWERGEAAVEANGELARVHGLLRRQIGRTFRLTWGELDDFRFAFEGEPDRLRFAVVEPPFPSRPGITLLTLEVVDHPSGTQLRYLRTPYHPDMSDFADAEPSEDIGLVAGPFDVRFAYLPSAAEEGERPEWQERWTEDRQLPQLVRLRVTAADGDELVWPDLVVNLDIDVDLGCLNPGETMLCALSAP